jgi:[acyl-carrier-protein] S-malonyltransferase
VSAGRRVALVFPGQGSQVVGMGKALCEALPECREIFDLADAALDMPLSRACFEGPEESLRMTATTQPAILATSMAALAALRAAAPGLVPGCVGCAAGHSLGEYSALVAAGALALGDALRTVRRRGEYMQEAVPVGEGAMAALLGATPEQVEALCAEAAQGEVLSPANLNAPDQTVVAGSTGAIDRLAALAPARGVRKVVRLAVSAPFHCALMAPAQRRLAADLQGLALKNAVFPIVQNTTAAPETRADGLRGAILEQVTSPVRWVETVRRMEKDGIEIVLEIGPGRVLSGLVRRIAPGLRLLNVEDPPSLDATVAALSGMGRAA